MRREKEKHRAWKWRNKRRETCIETERKGSVREKDRERGRKRKGK